MRKWVPPIKSPPFNQTTIKGQGGYPMELTSKDIQLSIQVGKSYYITFCGELKNIEEKSRSSIRKNDYPLGVMSYSRHSMIMMISVLKSLKKESIESVCRKYHIDHKTIPKKVKKKISVASTDLNAAYWRVLKEWKKDIKIIETRPTFTPSIRSTKTDH